MSDAGDRAASGKKILFAIAAVTLVLHALALIVFAAFPYVYAESGSARYAREHRGEALLALGGAAALLWIAWLLIRRSFALGKWAAFLGTLIGGRGIHREFVRVPRSAHLT